MFLSNEDLKNALESINLKELIVNEVNSPDDSNQVSKCFSCIHQIIPLFIQNSKSDDELTLFSVKHEIELKKIKLALMGKYKDPNAKYLSKKSNAYQKMKKETDGSFTILYNFNICYLTCYQTAYKKRYRDRVTVSIYIDDSSPQTPKFVFTRAKHGGFYRAEPHYSRNVRTRQTYL